MRRQRSYIVVISGVKTMGGVIEITERAKAAMGGVIEAAGGANEIIGRC